MLVNSQMLCHMKKGLILKENRDKMGLIINVFTLRRG